MTHITNQGEISVADCIAHIAELAEGELRRIAYCSTAYRAPLVKANAQRKLNIYRSLLLVLGPPTQGEITFSHREDGTLIAITKTDHETRVLSSIWMRP